MTDTQLLFRGRAFVFGDNVDTDAIYHASYLNLTEEKEIAVHCLEELYPGFSSKAGKGDILVAGDNFGCGSAREHAPVAIRGCGIACVIARSFSRLFYRNAINIGLPVIIADAASYTEEGDSLAIDCLTGKISLPDKQVVLNGAPLPGFMLEIIRAGGLTGYLEEILKKEGRMSS